MKQEFTKGENVVVTMKDGNKINGTIVRCDVNFCTFKDEYEIDYVKDGKVCTMICVPASAISR